MSDISTGLIEFAEHKRLLLERILHKLGGSIIDNNISDGVYLPNAQVYIDNSSLNSLYIESAETLELHTGLLGIEVDDNLKMKWIGLYATALAKEVHARIKHSIELGNGFNMTELSLSDYNNLLTESEREKEKLINLLNKKKP